MLGGFFMLDDHHLEIRAAALPRLLESPCIQSEMPTCHSRKFARFLSPLPTHRAIASPLQTGRHGLRHLSERESSSFTLHSNLL